jgi:two-component system, OmpR family, KDP operon response regulator KdpE
MNLPTILVIDDEASIRKLLRLTLEAVPYRVVEAVDGREGLHLLAAQRPSLVVLDMGLPDRHGKEILRELRTWTQVPVVILSVEKDPSTIVEALDIGADDYVTKPFQTNEFLARVRVCLRRSLTTVSEEKIVRIKDIEIDLEKRIVKKAGDLVHLTSLEYDFFSFLVKNQGKVVTHGQILKAVWGPQVASDSSYPRVYMRHLRQKLETSPDEPQILLTETGMGYRLVESL